MSVQGCWYANAAAAAGGRGTVGQPAVAHQARTRPQRRRRTTTTASSLGLHCSAGHCKGRTGRPPFLQPSLEQQGEQRQSRRGGSRQLTKLWPNLRWRRRAAAGLAGKCWARWCSWTTPHQTTPGAGHGLQGGRSREQRVAAVDDSAAGGGRRRRALRHFPEDNAGCLDGLAQRTWSNSAGDQLLLRKREDEQQEECGAAAAPSRWGGDHGGLCVRERRVQRTRYIQEPRARRERGRGNRVEPALRRLAAAVTCSQPQEPRNVGYLQVSQNGGVTAVVDLAVNSEHAGRQGGRKLKLQLARDRQCRLLLHDGACLANALPTRPPPRHATLWMLTRRKHTNEDCGSIAEWKFVGIGVDKDRQLDWKGVVCGRGHAAAGATRWRPVWLRKKRRRHREEESQRECLAAFMDKFGAL